MNKTGISWTDYTWNPVSGCSKVSEGHCKTGKRAGRCGMDEATWGTETWRGTGRFPRGFEDKGIP